MSTDDDTGSGGGRTFTQAEVNQIVADRLARERSKYADYDDLKLKAAEADKNKSQLDKIEQRLTEMQTRAEKAERETLIRDVAAELGLSPRLARRLEGKTREELLADGRETMQELGLKPGGKSTSTSGDAGDQQNGNGQQDDDRDDEHDDDNANDETSRNDGADRQPQRHRSIARRPAESLRSGAPATRETPDETNPLKLAAGIRRA